MGQRAAFLLQVGCLLCGLPRQEADEFVAEQVPVPLPFAAEVHRLETRDLEGPVAETRPGLELLELLPQGHAGLLHHHFGVVQVGEQRRQERVDRRFVPNEQGNELLVFRRS